MPEKYNIVFICSDQHRAKAMGSYGNAKVKTPNLDRLAAHSVRFTDAYCDSPLCAPSRASIVTGLRPHRHRALHHKLDHNEEGLPGIKGIGDVETMGTFFCKHGYVTGAFGKLHVHGETEQRDLGFQERGLRFYGYFKYRDYEAAVGKERKDIYIRGIGDGMKAHNYDNAPVAMEEEYMFDRLVTDRSVAFLEEHRDEPFFLWVGIEKPHAPWTAPKRFHDLYRPEEMDLPETLREQELYGEKDFLRKMARLRPTLGISDEAVKGSIAAYYANVTYMDESVGFIIGKLEELGLMDRTIIVYTSDHGEMLYEHGAIEKHCFYEASVKVPLLISCPAVLPEGTTCDYPAALVDLFPTLAELSGFAPPADTDGESLLGAIAGAGRSDKEIYSEFHMDHPDRMIRSGDWKYVYNHGRTNQLYHLKEDPEEVRNLAGSPEFAEVERKLRDKVLNGWQVTLEQGQNGR